jgi:hypothetical protein
LKYGPSVWRSVGAAELEQLGVGRSGRSWATLGAAALAASAESPATVFRNSRREARDVKRIMESTIVMEST